VPAEPAHQHKVLDRSSGGASTASVATTASCSSSSSSSSRSDCTWMYYGGMCARQQPEDVMLCPGCRRQTFDRTDATTVCCAACSLLLVCASRNDILTSNFCREQSKRTCHNGKWKWNGEPPFCCLCASFKGLGRLSQLGCEGCKVRRKCFYKRTSWLNSGCRHCGQQRTQHDGDGELAYPRCPGTASPAPSPNTSQHGKQE